MIGTPVAGLGVETGSSGSFEKSLDGSRTCCTGREGNKFLSLAPTCTYIHVCMSCVLHAVYPRTQAQDAVIMSLGTRLVPAGVYVLCF